jgi:hypothetical protein
MDRLTESGDRYLSVPGLGPSENLFRSGLHNDWDSMKRFRALLHN